MLDYTSQLMLLKLRIARDKLGSAEGKSNLLLVKQNIIFTRKTV